MQYPCCQRVFFKAALPVAVASLVWPLAQLPSRASGLSAPPSAASQTQLSRNNGWNSVLHVARLVEGRQRSTNLVLQLEVLNKPSTTYANAVYQVFARVRGDSGWQEIHTNRGARLMPGESGRFILESEVISMAELEAEIRDELGEDVDLEDVEFDCVVGIRYDLVGGGRDLREKITYRQRYSEIVATSTTEIVRTSRTVTASQTSSVETVSSRRTNTNRQAILTSRGDDDGDDEWDGDDDWDDDDDDRDDEGRRRRGSATTRTEEGRRRTSRRRTETRGRVNRANIWQSVLHVARQTSSRQSRNLVLQLEILNKPQTTYANVVYQVYARTRGGRWQEIHTNQGARLIEAARGQYVLTAEVISLAQLEQELRAELGENLRLDDVEINCVASIRYDLADGGRDIRETFVYQQSYTSIVTTTTTEITRILGSSTTVSDDRWETPCYRCGDDDDDDWEDRDDDWDDDDRHGRRRRHCNQGIGNGPEGCDPGNSRPHGGSNDEGGRRPGRGRGKR